jgi:imidazolonepropionase-like amidohydrolase
MMSALLVVGASHVAANGTHLLAGWATLTAFATARVWSRRATVGHDHGVCFAFGGDTVC